MIITGPNAFVAEVHERMPVLLMREQFDRWLSGEMGVEELKPAPNDYLERWAVSKRVNSSKADKDDMALTEKGRINGCLTGKCESMDSVGLASAPGLRARIRVPVAGATRHIVGAGRYVLIR
jgi:SOS response associated peptidase (SRAP)